MDVNTKNILAIKEFTSETRKIVNELKEQVDSLSKQVATQNGIINNLNAQIAVLHKSKGTGATSI